MKKVPTQMVKARSRELSALVDGFVSGEAAIIGTVKRCCVVDTAADGHSLVAHTKSYHQVTMMSRERLPQRQSAS